MPHQPLTQFTEAPVAPVIGSPSIADGRSEAAACAHAYKRVAQKPRWTFREAVTKWGDNWSIGVPLLCVGIEEKTSDFGDYVAMVSMEKGERARVIE